jgi:hypothetical protein
MDQVEAINMSAFKRLTGGTPLNEPGGGGGYY